MNYSNTTLYFKCLFLLWALFFMQTVVFAGGPWAEGKGKGYVEASSLFAVATTTMDHTYQIYAEVGVTEKFTLKTILPFKYISTPDDIDMMQFEPGKLFGVSNFVLGGKYEVYKKKVVMSAGLDVEMKTVKSNDALGLRTGYEKFTIRPIYSVGFGMEKVYTYSEFRPGFSTNGYGHDINLIAEVGGKVDENVWIAGYLEYKGVFKNGNFNDTDEIAYSATGYFRDEQNFFTAGVKLAAYLHKGFGLNGAVFYGRGVTTAGGGSSIAVKAGVFYDW
jgi:hypothetical protein